MTSKSRLYVIVAAIAVLALIGLRVAAGFLVDWNWFAMLGYAGVFWTTIAAKVALFAAVFVVTALALYLNAAVAHRVYKSRPNLVSVTSPWNAMGGMTPPVILERLYSAMPWRGLILAAALVLGALIALAQTSNWSVVLRYLYQVPYGRSEPLFGMDIGFYLFSLPAYLALKDWLLFTLVVAGLMAGLLYWLHGAILFDQQRRFIAPAAVAHFSVLLGLFLAVKAWDYWLQRFQLVYGDNGVVIGASYTDVHLQIPILWALAALALAAAAVSFANARGRSLRRPIQAALALALVAWFVAPGLAFVYERFYVKPNQLQLEAPFIARNIAMTREAYGLNNIEVKPFAADENLTFAALDSNRATIDNIRLWDYDPLKATYAQLQEIRTYYRFQDVDIDRYRLGGSYQQVMMSARELDPSLLPANAQTWVNLHVLYTHGSGIVMSPVTRTDTGGLPVLYVRDIPPVSTGGPAVTEPRIYFGEAADSYIIVRGSIPEFDYPRGDQNVYTTYSGRDGVAIGSLGSRLLYSWYFGDVNLLLSKYITADSRIVFRRNIRQRIGEIAPFLTLDKDPYIVVSNGRLFWIQDAYTVSDAFPYSKPASDNGLNYYRNSVKIVVDAYNGSVSFYMTAATDPIVRTYARIFPGLFHPISEMPADLRRHVRYPEDLFAIQAQMYATYHMSSPETFYNSEDLWQFPRRPTAENDNGDAKMEPYFLNTRLPGESDTEFVLMLPMVPRQRENMIAWMAARCDERDYGRLIVYTFPKDKQVYGPFQINALINQNTEVSQQITLWNASGSRVIHGNLLVVPIERSLLYVMPLYLRASSGQLPELKRVVAVFGGKVVMEETLAAALARLFPAPDASALAVAAPAGSPAAAPPLGTPARAALDHYNRAIAKLKAGDWAGFGAELDAIRPLLEQMNRQ